jgi:UDP-N-acetyl-D-glucosamine dehydrogenase|tara:strand:- start:6390 stop:7658 length:1269 start_codon:yes stop_codon:yes gene_type:complete
MNYYKELKKKINRNKAVVCVIGLGYVGSAIIEKFNNKNFKTIGIDKDKYKFSILPKAKKMKLTSDYKFVNLADIIIIALPTPLKKNMSPDLSYIISCMQKIKQYLKKGQLISLESTTYPGTTEEIILPILKKRNFTISKNFFLVYSPERISPELKVKDKTIKYKFHNTPKIYSGYSDFCKSLGALIYKKITRKVVLASSLKMAETTKMVENIFRSINIGLVNELKMFLDKIKIDINEALDLADTKPFGFTKFDPGPGYGGHCIPLDPFYLYWLAKKNNFKLKFIKTSGMVNKEVINWITNKILKFIKIKKIKLFEKKILILGVAYKANIDDTRESPAFKIAEKLKKNGYDFEYSDPYVKKIKFGNKIKKSKNINAKLLEKYPIVLLATDHAKFNYNLISKKAMYLFDSRNSIKNRKKNYFKV